MGARAEETLLEQRYRGRPRGTQRTPNEDKMMKWTSLTMVAALAAWTMACGGAPEEPPDEREGGEAAGVGRILRVDPRFR